MQILHIIAGDLNGGAARGAYSLHQGLKQQGITSKIYTNSKIVLKDNDITYLKNIDWLKTKIESLLFRILGDKNYLHTGIFGINFTKSQAYKEADIIHLHWINGLVNIKTLAQVTKPIIWTMRDMWPMTGGCHYSFECKNYKTGCGKCPKLMSNKKHDLSRYVIYRKKKYIPQNITIVGISDWLTNEAKQSELFHNKNVLTVKNSINTSKFYSLDSVVVQKNLEIITDKKIILCGASHVNSPQKGYDVLMEALKLLERDAYYLCFFGNIKDEAPIKDLGFEYKSFGYVADDRMLNCIYNIADVFVAPSIMEAFGKTLVEAMACKTPVVCFDYSGPRDIVDHKINGYRARPFEAKDLSQGIKWILNHKNYAKLGESAREKAQQFDNIAVAREYAKMYESIMNARS